MVSMKKSHVAAALLSTLAVGFISGRISDGTGFMGSDDKSSSAGKERTGRTRTSDRPEKDSASSQPQRLRDEIRKASPEALSALVYRALELSDPLQRRQLLLEIFSRMDAGNFEQMIRESERSSLESSRNNYDEWA